MAKALAAGADAVVIDLEDAVPPEQKGLARDTVSKMAGEPRPEGSAQLWVRVNPPGSAWAEADLRSASGWAVDGLRLPHAEDPEVVRQFADRVRLPVQLLLETAAGLARALDLAQAHAGVAGIGLGEADLSADLRVLTSAGLDWARGWVVVAARAAGLPSPIQSVWTDVADIDGLRRTTEIGRDTGFVGRSVVHPRQVPVVHKVFQPPEDQLRAAQAVLQAADEARARGEVALLDPDGRFVDPAVVERARVVLALAARSTPRPATDPGATA
ncbi:citrate lyase subunit beta/citryl-CoA lyase [Nonomuraea thailandensis]|uniref:Citrate lyase subunit beta/citryl-CoA lyase n=1 Tax=Nonomuraea thailandensis TaxID=1188745 RepID=A0A9X2JXX7_9ACTN|nr:citrate lyase subunit beta/citryl-CoA lyase [Nonomuraea thailandensis]